MSDILVTGTIITALPVKSGVSQSTGNQWSRASYIIEHEHGQYPKSMLFDVVGNKIQELALCVGEEVTVHLNVSCREYPQGSGKYFNSIEAWRVDRAQVQQPQQAGYAPQSQAPFPPQQPQVQQPVGQAPFPPQQPQGGQPQQSNLPFPPQQ